MKSKRRRQPAPERPASGETLTRRRAIARIAAALAGAAVGAPALVRAGEPVQRKPHNPYADSVYASRQPDYQRYISYYTSYRSHYTSVPPPGR